jgi:V-type H+-transporting ATPase subunit H
MRTTKHPLFIRLDQRDAIFRDTNPATLCLESENTEETKRFIALFQQPPERELEEFAKDASFSETFVKLLSARSDPQRLSLLCAFIDRLIDIDFNLVMRTLVPQAAELASTCSNILVAHTADHSKHPFLVRTILLLLGSIISERGCTVEEVPLERFTNTTLTFLSGKLSQASVALEGLKRALRSEAFRAAFIENKGINLLLDLLQQSQKVNNTDALYHILFCIWALTYSAEGAGQLSEGEFVPQLARLLSNIQPEREELVRLLTLIISQLNPSISFIEAAYDNDMLRLIRSFQTKHYVDPELAKLIAETGDKMNLGLKHLSLWDKYVREVKSGRLHNSLSHRSELFWKANVERFGENNFAVLLALRDLLKSDDEETVTVACHDLGEYVSRHPLGRVKLEEIHAKEIIMELMSSKSPAIQSQALRTTQLLLLRSGSA